MKTVNRNKGFTLVELIVVIAIVAILASISMVGYSKFITNARDSNAYNEFNQVYNVIFIDASRPNESDDYHISTNGGKLTISFDSNDHEVIKTGLIKLLSIYLNAGFYQGEFIFEKNYMSYNRPGGGSSGREIVFDYDVKVSITVKSDGSLESAINSV